MNNYKSVEEFYYSDFYYNKSNIAHRTTYLNYRECYFWKQIIINGIKCNPLSYLDGDEDVFLLCFEPDTKQQFKQFLELQKKYDFCVLG